MRYYLIAVGNKYVASPYADCLTDDRSKAAVFTDLNIDAVFGRWDKETDGKADIVETDWRLFAVKRQINDSLEFCVLSHFKAVLVFPYKFT